jgi:FlaA1/EpsC-like NDP-sugar epimerase
MADAAELIMTAGATTNGGDIYVPKLKSLNVVDLAQAMIEVLAVENGYSPSEIKLIEIGKQKGEKMFEELMTEDEAQCACDEGTYFVVNLCKEARQQKDSSRYSSEEVQNLSKDEIKQLLKKIYRQ